MKKRKKDITDKIASLIDKHIEPVIQKHIYNSKNEKDFFVNYLHVYGNINIMALAKLKQQLNKKALKNFANDNIKRVLELS
tara:strand:+ start:1061 stop:1303 length:243 start_codon:yes stop_codon:yes gene_type:complete